MLVHIKVSYSGIKQQIQIDSILFLLQNENNHFVMYTLYTNHAESSALVITKYGVILIAQPMLCTSLFCKRTL